MKRTVNTVLTFEDKVFTNDSGERIEYMSITAKIAGEDIRLEIKKEDKSLFKYLTSRVQSEVK